MNNLRNIPKIDKFLTNEIFGNEHNATLNKIAKQKINQLREDLISKKISTFDEKELIKEVKNEYDKLFASSLKPLINATGVILHTNMGRSVIHETLLKNASKVICNYSNLEYNQEEGCRGERYAHVRVHLKTLLGVEDVLLVNNNASAVFLVLNTFAKGKEAIVSRGELVEIGGSFRIPEVMSQSGALLKEVGTTNKTKTSDYKNAICEKTSMLMKVHQSNFSIEGFSEDTDYKDIQELSSEFDLIDYYDIGSGYIPELPYNLGKNDPSIKSILENDPSLISFSGDKLFGSVQAGIIAGKKILIDKLKQNQLLRMLRVDKITIAILEESIKAYIKEQYKLIPTLALLFTDIEELQERAQKVQSLIGKEKCTVIRSQTIMGGGTLPNRKFPTIALHVEGKADKLEKLFRQKNLIGRIEKDMFLIDFRSIEKAKDEQIIEIIKEIL